MDFHLNLNYVPSFLMLLVNAYTYQPWYIIKSKGI